MTCFTFDQRPCPDAGIDHLQVGLFLTEYLPKVVAPEVLAENRRTVEEQLASLRFFDIDRNCATYAGVLAFGRDVEYFLAGGYVQFVRFDGQDRAAAVVDQKKLSGNLISQMLQLDNLLPVQIRSPRVPGGSLRMEERPDYDRWALRELAINAVMHRTYEGTNAPVLLYWFTDRVEVQSPGGLYGQVTPQNFTSVNDYRNPVIAECMKVLHYVERFGTGIRRAQEALRQNGNPPAEFTFEPTHVLVTVRSRVD